MVEVRDLSDNFLVGFRSAKQAARFLRWLDRQGVIGVRVESYNSDGEPERVFPREEA